MTRSVGSVGFVVFAVFAVLAIDACARLPDPRDPRIEVVASAAPPLPTDVTPLPTPSTIAAPRELRIVELNTHGQPGEIIVDALRGDPMLRDADIYVFTEIHRADGACSAACVVARALGYASVYAPGHAEGDATARASGGAGDGGVAIVARARIDAPRVIELPEYAIHVARERRIALVASLQLDAASAPIAVYAIHLENRLTPRERRAQLAPVLDDAALRSAPVIIAGDVNTSPFSWLAHLLPVPTGTQAGKLERFVRSRGFDTPVVNSGATSRFLQMRLDAVYTRGIETRWFEVSNAKDVSDHFAMVMNESI